jgi:glutaconyl-CoA decarboxylase
MEREIESVQNIYGGLKTAMEASMKRYNITVNGAVYIVEVEEEGASAAKTLPASGPAAQAPAPMPQAPVPAPMPQAQAPAAQTPAPAPKASAPATGATVIDCPMPGNIRDILVVPGQAVKSGETLLVLEAMKMENEIIAPQDGTVDTIRVSKGASVNAGDVLVTML